MNTYKRLGSGYTEITLDSELQEEETFAIPNPVDTVQNLRVAISQTYDKVWELTELKPLVDFGRYMQILADIEQVLATRENMLAELAQWEKLGY